MGVGGCTLLACTPSVGPQLLQLYQMKSSSRNVTELREGRRFACEWCECVRHSPRILGDILPQIISGIYMPCFFLPRMLADCLISYGFSARRKNVTPSFPGNFIFCNYHTRFGQLVVQVVEGDSCYSNARQQPHPAA